MLSLFALEPQLQASKKFTSIMQLNLAIIEGKSQHEKVGSDAAWIMKLKGTTKLRGCVVG